MVTGGNVSQKVGWHYFPVNFFPVEVCLSKIVAPRKLAHFTCTSFFKVSFSLVQSWDQKYPWLPRHFQMWLSFFKKPDLSHSLSLDSCCTDVKTPFHVLWLAWIQQCQVLSNWRVISASDVAFFIIIIHLITQIMPSLSTDNRIPSFLLWSRLLKYLLYKQRKSLQIVSYNFEIIFWKVDATFLKMMHNKITIFPK